MGGGGGGGGGGEEGVKRLHLELHWSATHSLDIRDSPYKVH